MTARRIDLEFKTIETKHNELLQYLKYLTPKVIEEAKIIDKILELFASYLNVDLQYLKTSDVFEKSLLNYAVFLAEKDPKLSVAKPLLVSAQSDLIEQKPSGSYHSLSAIKKPRASTDLTLPKIPAITFPGMVDKEADALVKVFKRFYPELQLKHTNPNGTTVTRHSWCSWTTHTTVQTGCNFSCHLEGLLNVLKDMSINKVLAAEKEIKEVSEESKRALPGRKM